MSEIENGQSTEEEAFPDSYEAAVELFGGVRKAAFAMGIPYSTFWDRLRQEKDTRPVLETKYVPQEIRTLDLPEEGQVKRYICTSVQNNTPLEANTWANLLALKKHYNAELLISPFRYIRPEKDENIVWDAKVLPYLQDNRLQLAPGLVFAAELNILPTAVLPLSALHSYTGTDSTIVPHPKHAMESVATGIDTGAKFLYTTGAVSEKNYIPMKAGFKAEFHHIYGGLIVEVDSDGNWWVRQLTADKNGNICDLNLEARIGDIHHTRIRGISWGDIHVEQIDPEVEDVSWGSNGMAQTLRPEFQIFHDLLDFKSRSHHSIRNPHQRFRDFTNDQDSVEDEVSKTLSWLKERALESQSWSGECYIAPSNHDDALERWLREADYRFDEKNALFFLRLQHRLYRAIAGNDDNFQLLRWLYHEDHDALSLGVRFLNRNESLRIDDVELGAHGHLGVNGSRGSRSGFTKLGTKMTIGHSHSCGINAGVFQCGTTSKLRLSYNDGPSTWSHTHCLQYLNGKRTLITVRNGKWRA